MASDEIEYRLNEIGQILAEDMEYPLDNTLLYAKLDHMMVSAAIFKNLSNQILYRWSHTKRLDYTLLELWEAEDPDKRWAEMEYVIRDGKFEASFTFREEIDPDEDPLVRRDRIVRRHFGEKPINYPPMPDDEHIRRFEQ